MSYSTALTEAVYKSEGYIINYTPYLTLTGKVWGVFCEDSVEYWPRYNIAALNLGVIEMLSTKT